MDCQCEHLERLKEWLQYEVETLKSIRADVGLTLVGDGMLEALEVTLDYAESPARLKFRARQQRPIKA